MLSEPLNVIYTHEAGLAPGATFTGPWRDLHSFAGVSVLLAGSEVVVSGRFEWSTNANKVRLTSPFISGVAPSSLTGGAASCLIAPLARYVRVVVENGPVQQPDDDYILQVILLVNTPDIPTAGGGSGGGLTNAELRASPVPVSVSGEMEVKNDSGNPLSVSGTVAVSNFPATQPVSGTVAVSNFPASVEVSNDAGNPLPVSGTVGVSGSVAVTGPLTDTQLRATPVPVSGTVTVTDGSGPLTVDGTVSVGNFPSVQPVNDNGGSLTVDGTVGISGTVPVSGPLTDAQLRATPVPISGTVATGGLTDTQLRATPVPVSGSVTTGGLTDTQLRATPVPVSGTVTANVGTGVQPVNDNGGSLTVDGTVNVGNFPATQPVSGPLTDAQLRAVPVPVSGTVTVNQPVSTRELNQLIPAQYDFIDLNYTGDDITTVIYKTGGSGGTTVATLTLVYSAPGVLDTVTRT